MKYSLHAESSLMTKMNCSGSMSLTYTFSSSLVKIQFSILTGTAASLFSWKAWQGPVEPDPFKRQCEQNISTSTTQSEDHVSTINLLREKTSIKIQCLHRALHTHVAYWND